MTEVFHDPVNAPKHYRGKNIEAIDYIESWALGFHLGNAAKYIIRAGDKGDLVEDLKKACWYLRRAIAFGGQLQTARVTGLNSETAQKEFDLPDGRAWALSSIEHCLRGKDRQQLISAIEEVQREINRVSAAG